MTHEYHIQPYHKHVAILMLVGCIAIFFLLLSVWSLQRNNGSRFSLFGPTVAPTPISNGTITVIAPHADEHVPQNFIVAGTTMSDKVHIRLRDKYSGQIITDGLAMSNAAGPGQAGKFGAELKITDDSIRSEAPLILEVFESTANNQEHNKITIPLTFTPVGQ